MEYLWIILLFCTVQSVYSLNTFDVTKYGAIGNENTDDSQAFLDAWTAACSAKTSEVAILVPHGKTFWLRATQFTGPCQAARVHFQVFGEIMAPDSPWSNNTGYWLSFNRVNGLIIRGEGKIDGKGAIWWKQCPQIGKCTRPVQIGFFQCDNLLVKGVTFMNSPRSHVEFKFCNNVNVTDVKIFAPDLSPNTDGIAINFSTHVYITDTILSVGDDCVAIQSGCSHVYITRVTCGPGHGISIGSLGVNGDQNAKVEEIHVEHSIIKSATNGLRIKTWKGAGGYARHISYYNVTFEATTNPIIINQNYCSSNKCPEISNEANAVKISNVSFTEVKGTVKGNIGVMLNCSKLVGCTGIVMKNIDLISADAASKVPLTVCSNAYGKVSDTQPPVQCLLS